MDPLLSVISQNDVIIGLTFTERRLPYEEVKTVREREHAKAVQLSFAYERYYVKELVARQPVLPFVTCTLWPRLFDSTLKMLDGLGDLDLTGTYITNKTSPVTWLLQMSSARA